MSATETRIRAASSQPVQETKLSDLGWSIYLPIAIGFLLLLWLNQVTFSYWYAQWMRHDSYYQHAPLVPFIAAFVVWLKRKRLRDIPIIPSPAGYLLVVPGLILSVIMTWAGAKEPQGMIFPIIVAGMVLVLFGRQIARELRFPLAYLYFMVVLPGDILTKLSFRIQLLSTIVATSLLRIMGLDASRVGVKIELPNVDVLVGGPCSGFRLLISLFALTILFVYLVEGPKWGKALLIGLMCPLSVVLNSVRITMIALVGEKWGYDVMHSFHDYSGYIMLVLAFIILWLLAGLVKCQKLNSMLSP